MSTPITFATQQYSDYTLVSPINFAGATILNYPYPKYFQDVGKILRSDNLTTSINYFNGTLHFVAGTAAMNYSQALCYDTSSASSLGWNVRLLFDSSEASSVAWDERKTYDSSGFFPSIDWQNRRLIDGNGDIAVDWNARQLKNASGTVTVDWNNPISGGSSYQENILINPLFAINQRAYVSGTATTTANQYTLDRWRVVTSGQNLTFSANQNGNIVTAPAGGVEQVIEGNNIQGGTYTLTWTGTASATVNGTSVAKNATIVLTANTNATVRFTGGTVYAAQLALGTSTFVQRLYGEELLLCQRYLEVIGGVANARCGSGRSINSSLAEIQYFYNVKKRAKPNITFQNATDWVVNDAAVNAAVTSLSSDFGSETFFDYGVNTAATLTGYRPIIYSCTTTSLILCECEL